MLEDMHVECRRMGCVEGLAVAVFYGCTVHAQSSVRSFIYIAHEYVQVSAGFSNEDFVI